MYNNAILIYQKPEPYGGSERLHKEFEDRYGGISCIQVPSGTHAELVPIQNPDTKYLRIFLDETGRGSKSAQIWEVEYSTNRGEKGDIEVENTPRLENVSQIIFDISGTAELENPHVYYKKMKEIINSPDNRDKTIVLQAVIQTKTGKQLGTMSGIIKLMLEYPNRDIRAFIDGAQGRYNIVDLPVQMLGDYKSNEKTKAFWDKLLSDINKEYRPGEIAGIISKIQERLYLSVTYSKAGEAPPWSGTVFTKDSYVKLSEKDKAKLISDSIRPNEI